MNCTKTNKIFLFSRFYIFLWVTKAFSLACNATYCIANAKKMFPVAPELETQGPLTTISSLLKCTMLHCMCRLNLMGHKQYFSRVCIAVPWVACVTRYFNGP